MPLHKHLQRLISKHLGGFQLKDEQALGKFIDSINETFTNYEQDKSISQHAFDLSDDEYQKINQELLGEKIIRERSIKTLLNTISAAGLELQPNAQLDTDNLLSVSEFLETQVKLRKQVETELAEKATLLQRQMEISIESEEKFRALTEKSTDVIMRFDRDKKHIY